MDQESSVDPGPVRGQVLLFRTPRKDHRSLIRINVLLLPGNVPVDQVAKNQKLTTEYISTPHQCELVHGRFYSVDCPSAEFVVPKRAQFDMDYHPNYFPTFLLYLPPQSSPVSITVREAGTSEVVWSHRLSLSESLWGREKSMASPHRDVQTLLGSVRPDFVQNVTDPVLDQLLDRLLHEKVMHQEEVETAKVKCREKKARYVVDTVMRKGSQAAFLLIQNYCQLDPTSKLSGQLQHCLTLLPGAEGDQIFDSEELGEGTSAVQGKRKLTDSVPSDPTVGSSRGFETRDPSSGPEPWAKWSCTQGPPHHGEEMSKPPHHKTTASVEESTSNFQPTTTKQHKWVKISERWSVALKDLHNSLEQSAFTQIGSLKYSEKFLIGKGSVENDVFLGLRNDGTEVAIKRTIKSNIDMLKKEKEFLRLPKLDHPNIVQYIDFAEDSNFGYLALQLCEYTLEEHIENLKGEPIDVRRKVQKTLVQQLLTGLSVLHGQKPRILHRDLKPQNVLIDIKGQARLAGFGLSIKLPNDDSTVYTHGAGTTCWMAREILRDRNKELIPHNFSTDVQVAGMLVYYILSGGKHPFDLENDFEIESNIYNGKYRLDHVEDEVAKDLVEEMINQEPEQRPRVDECLRHAFFWEDSKQLEYLKRLGNHEEILKCQNAPQELISAVEECDVKGSLKNWKQKFPDKLIQKMDPSKQIKLYPENPLGLLRFIRNFHEHCLEEAENIDMTELFPDLFGIIYTFAKKRGWNQEPHLKKMFQREGGAPGDDKPSPAIKQKVPAPSTSKRLEDEPQPGASNWREETKFSPEVSREARRLLYRFSCPSSGTFRCSSTGLVFVVTEEAELQYRIVQWDVAQLESLGRTPAGPLYNVRCSERAVCELHLPHCEPENADLSQCQLSVAHISDSGLSLIEPQRITQSHVVIPVSGLSEFGLTWLWQWFSSKPKTVSGKVLLFRSPREQRTDIQINVHLLISTIPLDEVKNKQQGTTEFIDAPPQCELIIGQYYCVKRDRFKVQPKRAPFKNNNDPDYSHVFQIRLPPDRSTVLIALKKDSSSEVVWEYKWNLNDAITAELQRGEREKVLPVSSGRSLTSLLIESDVTVKKKLSSLRFEFIQRVSEAVLDQLLDLLRQRGALTAAEREELASKKRRDRAAQLLDSVLNKGSKVSRLFIQVFEDEDPHLLNDLLQTTES